MLQGIDIPTPTLNVSGTMDRGISPTESALALLGSVCLLMSTLAYRLVDAARRPAVLFCGGGILVMILAAQWTTHGDQKTNLDLVRLARADAYTDLFRLAKSRSTMPYAPYIGAQALALSGEKAQLKAEYGDWLMRWSGEAAQRGYVGDARVPRGTPVWEGTHASPQVMRALEIAAFGQQPTPFARRYLRDTLERLSTARQLLYRLAPAGALAALVAAGLFATWRRAKRNLRLAEEWVVRFDYYQETHEPAAPTVASPAPVAAAPLPPIPFSV